MVIIGDSIEKRLMRYQDIWKTFDSFNTVTMGIGGDKCQHVLWRCQNINFPSTVKYSVLIVGTNNIDSSSPNDIANSIIRIALSLANENKNMRVIILGILPRDMNKNSIRRYKISEFNDILEKNCKSSSDKIVFAHLRTNNWLEKNGSFKHDLYHS